MMYAFKHHQVLFVDFHIIIITIICCATRLHDHKLQYQIATAQHLPSELSSPIGSMYDTFTYIWLIVISMVNVGKYTIVDGLSYC